MKALLTLCLMIAGCAHASAADRNLNTQDPVANALHFAVAIVDEAGDTFCSGAIVDGAVLTAAHCVIGQKEVLVKWMGHTLKPEAVMDYREQDLALLRVSGLPMGLRLAEAAPRYGAEIFLVGHPLGVLDHNVGFGRVAHPRRELDLGCDRHTCFPNPHLMVDIIIVGGSSGSPVLNAVGDVVGVISFGFGRSWSLGGAVHLDTIKLLKERKWSN